jgi:hypothetical protein
MAFAVASDLAGAPQRIYLIAQHREVEVIKVSVGCKISFRASITNG